MIKSFKAQPINLHILFLFRIIKTTKEEEIQCIPNSSGRKMEPHTHKKQTDCRSSQSERETDAWKDVRGAAEKGKKRFKNELRHFKKASSFMTGSNWIVFFFSENKSGERNSRFAQFWSTWDTIWISIFFWKLFAEPLHWSTSYQTQSYFCPLKKGRTALFLWYMKSVQSILGSFDDNSWTF